MLTWPSFAPVSKQASQLEQGSAVHSAATGQGWPPTHLQVPAAEGDRKQGVTVGDDGRGALCLLLSPGLSLEAKGDFSGYRSALRKGLTWGF